jgi:hypothetical protein
MESEEFYPISVNFRCENTFVGMSIDRVVNLADETEVEFSADTKVEPRQFLLTV